jgi:hypothetical protein
MKLPRDITLVIVIISSSALSKRRGIGDSWLAIANCQRGIAGNRTDRSNIQRVIEWPFLYSPLYRDINNFIGVSSAGGKYGLGRRLLTHGIYALFLLNSSQRGDVIMILAER